MRKTILQNESGLAFPVIIGLFSIFLGLALWLVMDEVVTPLQNAYIGNSIRVNGTILNFSSDAHAGYLNQAWSILPLILILLGVIYILVNAQKN